LADIVAPAETLAFQENNGRFAWSSREEPECAFLGKGFPGPVRGWHGKDWTFNAAFIDGHADIIYMNGYRNDDVVHYPPDGDSDQVNLAQNYRCIIIRGDGWRKDTLPLPFVDAPLISALPRPSWERGIE